jgi:hypothetical protein
LPIPKNIGIKEWLKKRQVILSVIAAIAGIYVALKLFGARIMKISNTLYGYIKGLPLSVIYIFIWLAVGCSLCLLVTMIRRSRARRDHEKNLSEIEGRIICYLGDTSRHTASYKELRDSLCTTGRDISFLQKAAVELGNCKPAKPSKDTTDIYRLAERGKYVYRKLVDEGFCHSQDYERPSDKSGFISF